MSNLNAKKAEMRPSDSRTPSLTEALTKAHTGSGLTGRFKVVLGSLGAWCQLHKKICCLPYTLSTLAAAYLRGTDALVTEEMALASIGCL